MELVEIGKIINTFGIKGDLKIASSTDFGEQRFAPGSHIFVKTPREYLDFEISKHYIHKGFDMIAFKGYTDINEVEKYKGCICYAPKDTSLLPEGMHYIGKETDVYQGAQAIIGVDVNGKKVMIPYIDAFVKNKDIEHKRIDVSLIGGFLDED